MTSPDITVLRSERTATVPKVGTWLVKNTGQHAMTVGGWGKDVRLRPGDVVVCRWGHPPRVIRGRRGRTKIRKARG